MLAERPELLPELVWYASAFTALSQGRAVANGGVEQAISLMEIKAYIDIFDIHSHDDKEEFVWLMREMDYAYLVERAAVLERKRKND